MDVNNTVKTEELFKEIYSVYPKGVSAIKDKELYLNSVQYLNLKYRLNNANQFYGIEALESIKSDLETEFIVNVSDFTVESWLDRCYNWQFLLKQRQEDKAVRVMCINISKILPVYFIYILEVEFDYKLNRLKYLPRRNSEIEQNIYKSEIRKIEKILCSNIKKLKPFPENIMLKKIYDVNFQDIEMGEFTFFNAFFLNNFTTRLS